MELFVVTGDGEALGFVGGLEREALTDVRVADADFVAVDGVGGIERAVVFNLLVLDQA